MPPSYAKTRISLHNGEVHHCCEWPQDVVKKRRDAVEGGHLLELERPTTPAGDKFWVDPEQVSSIKAAR